MKYATVLRRQDIMEQLTAEREHFLESLHVLLRELKPFLSENHKCPDDIDISPVCWETKRLKSFHNEVYAYKHFYSCYLDAFNMNYSSFEKKIRMEILSCKK